MGLLWTVIGISLVVQYHAGLVEFVAAILLLWQRAAWLGALIGFDDLAVVWLLNTTFEVPVKLTSAFQTLFYLLVRAPWLFRFLAGRASESVEAPRVITNDKVHRVTRFSPPWPRWSRWVRAGSRWPLVLDRVRFYRRLRSRQPLPGRGRHS